MIENFHINAKLYHIQTVSTQSCAEDFRPFCINVKKDDKKLFKKIIKKKKNDKK